MPMRCSGSHPCCAIVSGIASNSRLYTDVELPLARILAAMERAGIAVDPDQLASLSAEVDAAVARLQVEIFAAAGETFNIGSPQQLGTVLFEKLALPNAGRTKTGWATGVDVLQAARARTCDRRQGPSSIVRSRNSRTRTST